MRYNLAFEGFGPVLAGANNGKFAFASLVQRLEKEPDTPTPLFLDFKDVEVATASFLRESLFSLKAYVRTAGSMLYPVAANANEVIYDEILMVANARGDAILGCVLSDQDEVSDVDLIGHLEPKQQLTFELVNELKRADAGGLMRRYGAAEQIRGVTAWNNRLASLATRGLIFEFTQGRAKYYRPVLEAAS